MDKTIHLGSEKKKIMHVPYTISKSIDKKISLLRIRNVLCHMFNAYQNISYVRQYVNVKICWNQR